MIGSLPPADAALLLRGGIVLGFAAWAARPIALRLVPGGGGWIGALLVGWIVVGWVPWAVSALWLVPFDAASLSGLVLLLVARAAVPSPPLVPDLAGALATAVGFAVLFWLGLSQRLMVQDLTGLEKFTDMAFLASAMRSEWMPPPDAWFSGATINYYYVGQAMVGAWGLVAGASAPQAYQIGMAVLFALTGLAVFRIAAGLVTAHRPWFPEIAGTMAMLLTLYGGNLHSVLYTVFRGWMPTTKDAFFYPDSTRFIGFDPPVDDKGFTEFPSYAFAVGDLHAHVIATPVFLFGMMLLLAILRRGLAGQAPDRWQAVAFGAVLGIVMSINSWDVATLGLVALTVLAVLALRPEIPLRQRLDLLGEAIVLAAASAALTAALFLGSFLPFAEGIVAAPATSPVWQLLVIYGAALPALGLYVALAANGRSETGQIEIGLLICSALILVAIPETVIVRDIYGADFARSNTMFKLSFRAQNLLVIAGSAIVMIAATQGRVWAVAGAVAAVPLVAPLVYAAYIFQAPNRISSLDGLQFLGEDRSAVERLGALPLDAGSSIIEASGDPFGPTARASAMTGQPAVMGWANHQWLWRGDSTSAFRRADAVRAFYTTADQELRCRIIQRHAISYALIGTVEKEIYPDLRADLIAALGTEIHSDGSARIIQFPQTACR
jgi:uncharacterized membrane protein